MWRNLKNGINKDYHCLEVCSEYLIFLFTYLQAELLGDYFKYKWQRQVAEFTFLFFLSLVSKYHYDQKLI